MIATDSGSIAAALAAATARLEAAGVPDARFDARLLAAHALDLPSPGALTVRGSDPMPDAAARRLEALLDRRAAREPVGRILGRRGFWTLDLALGPETLEPRPDTETVVTAVLDRLPDPEVPLSVLDLGTGTGAILLALLAECRHADGLGLDIAPGAVAAAADNAERNGLSARARFQVSDWRDGLTEAPGPYDIIVSNPPYIATAELATLAPEVRAHDPVQALDGGSDGLDAYRVLVPLAASRLHPGGWLAVEVGAGQAETVADLMRAAGLENRAAVPDLTGTARCVIGARPGKKRTGP
ncbi:peptide chain release factor N(5)-glutamine methyltransferase [Roseospira marina]|uniref:Release factor glutamine methyltransferase n=1 Tax=Roseospira marina TaxID=140057 RepID=A0A5M6IHI8_9PROT|nr:peptide chain release factor N(5)-glutamine methyltransferase [Roseospira marina]KAA5607028.1 peptide chain release factor N(5)-glutamine methyltransferase [Roseospira marina]MBB4312786.1 release factor glutamine methyltransferase [Roseospira marina]MBB5086441.1 release factor glutamine methyltransferase [Roseospira marina]